MTQRSVYCKNCNSYILLTDLFHAPLRICPNCEIMEESTFFTSNL